MSDALTKVDVATALARLAVLRKQKDAPDAGTAVDVYHARLKALPRAAVLEVAMQLAGRAEWFPLPNELYEAVCEHVRQAAGPRRFRYSGQPGVVCRTCGSRPRLAIEQERNPKTGEVHERQRYHAPCDPDQHAPGEPIIQLPPTFVRWADEAPAAEVGAHA
jgi:hypothetical protein